MAATVLHNGLRKPKTREEVLHNVSHTFRYSRPHTGSALRNTREMRPNSGEVAGGSRP
jgi:hypothetical protein